MNYIGMINNMRNLQEEVNTRVGGKNWKKHNNDWSLAVIEETVELMASLPWKWWKAGDSDWDNVKIELVDLMAFTLSHELNKSKPMPTAEMGSIMGTAEIMFDYNKIPGLKQRDLLEICLKNINHASNRDPKFATLAAMIATTLPFTEFYQLFIGKAVLNIFRQDNGYKQGTYQKIWDGKEDNQVMQELLYSIDTESLMENPKILHEKLDVYYKSVKEEK